MRNLGRWRATNRSWKLSHGIVGIFVKVRFLTSRIQYMFND
ncbi:hypothetical protein NM65012_2173 [Neisseria meningitidis 65012]|nr:hypothetical protein NM65012_2173 [Neisseria meningitidis 65012]